MQALTKLNPTDPVRFDSMNAILGEIEGRDSELAKQINVLEGSKLSNKSINLSKLESTSDQAIYTCPVNLELKQINVLEGSKLSNKSINLSKLESTSDQAIYTCPVNLELNKLYILGTGSSPTGTVQTIILRCNLGDYTFKISNTNAVDTMQNATWGDFNAGVRVMCILQERNETIILRCNLGDYTFKISNTNAVDTMQNATWGDFNAGVRVMCILQERNDVKGAVIVSVPYSTKYFATTEKTSFSLVAETGYKFTTQHCYVMDNIAFIRGQIKKADDSNFTVGTQMKVATTPVRPLTTTFIGGACTTASVSQGSVNIAVDSTKFMYVTPNHVGDRINFGGFFPV